MTIGMVGIIVVRSIPTSSGGLKVKGVRPLRSHIIMADYEAVG